MKRKVVHWFTGDLAVLCGLHYTRLSPGQLGDKYKKVTCKNCLKRRKK